MTVQRTGALSGDAKWKAVDWQEAQRCVRRLQMRIAKAVKEGRQGRVKTLQWILTHSRHAKLLAVKRVTSNKGKKTPGVDGILWKGPKAKIQAAYSLQRHGYRAQPLRRIYIPKKNGKMRPLSIPTMYDRAMQALYKLALAPVAETTADRNSYGFREGRSCADAVAAAFNALSKPNSATHILEGDISSHPYKRRIYVSGANIPQTWQYLACNAVERGSSRPCAEGRRPNTSTSKLSDGKAHQEAQSVASWLGQLPPSCGVLGDIQPCR